MSKQKSSASDSALVAEVAMTGKLRLAEYVRWKKVWPKGRNP